MKENDKKVSILFWGTPEFSIPAFEALIKGGYKIAAVITNPDEPKGRAQELTPPPIKVAAGRHDILVLQPEKLEIKNFKSEIPEADLYIVAAYGKIISKEILELPRYGVLNIHPSLLPRWRGPSPIQYAILNGDKEAGVTIIQIDELMDHGPIVAQRKAQNINCKAAYQELHDLLARLGAELLTETLPKYLTGEITPIPQNDLKATFSKLFKRDDGRVDWKKSAEDIDRMIRALNPWPGTWTLLPARDKIYRVKIQKGEAVAKESGRTSGNLWTESGELFAQTGIGSILLKELTMEGKKPLTGKDFLKGYSQFIGATLI